TFPGFGKSLHVGLVKVSAASSQPDRVVQLTIDQGRVTRHAMANGGQVGAAGDRILERILSVCPFGVRIGHAPERLLIIWGWNLVSERLYSAKIGHDGFEITGGQRFVEVDKHGWRKGHTREPCMVWASPLDHRPLDFAVVPVANPGLAVRGNIGRRDR